MELSDADVAVAAARAGARVVARDYRNAPVPVSGSPVDLTTQTDLDAESAIIGVIDRHRPADARVAEESGITGNDRAARKWLIDPLCGTTNFVASTPLLSTNVALLDGDTPLVAAAADPVAGEIFWADGARAYRREKDHDESLHPTPRSHLVEINCDGPLNEPFVGGQLINDPLLRSTYGPRVISSTLGLAWVAAGRRAAYISDGHFRSNVHYAAGIAICQASGCIVSSLDATPLHTGRGILVSADRDTHERLIEIVKPHLAAITDG